MIKKSYFSHLFLKKSPLKNIALGLVLFHAGILWGGSPNELDEFSFFDAEDAGFDQAFYDHIITRRITPWDIITILTSEDIQLQDILQTNLYCSTNPVNVRPVLDLPALLVPLPLETERCGTFTFMPFFNQTREQYLTKHSPYLASYLNFSNAEFTDLFDKLKKILQEKGFSVDSFNLPRILSLFDQVKLEERRIGAFFEWFVERNNLRFRMQLPLYYLEHNFFLTKAERDRIANEPLFESSGNNQDSSQLEDFLTQHMVSDFFGIGDTRFDLMYVFSRGCNDVGLGLELTLPTSAYVVDRLMGHHYDWWPDQPLIDLVEVLDSTQEGFNELQPMLISLGVKALHRLIRIAGDTRLGEEFTGVGARVEWNCHVDDQLTLFNLLRLQIQTPYNTVRFMKEIKNAANMERDYDNQADAANNLVFLMDRLVNTIYPPAENVHVAPAFNLEYTFAPHIVFKCIDFDFGYDFWYRTREQLQLLPCGNITGLPLDVPASARFSACQNKVFAKLSRYWDRGGHSVNFGAAFDYTFASSGIGRDWTAVLSCVVTW